MGAPGIGGGLRGLKISCDCSDECRYVEFYVRSEAVNDDRIGLYQRTPNSSLRLACLGELRAPRLLDSRCERDCRNDGKRFIEGEGYSITVVKLAVVTLEAFYPQVHGRLPLLLLTLSIAVLPLTSAVGSPAWTRCGSLRLAACGNAWRRRVAVDGLLWKGSDGAGVRIDAGSGDLRCYCPRASRHESSMRCAVSLNISLAVRPGLQPEHLAVLLMVAHPCSLAAACEGGAGHLLPEAKGMSPCQGSLSSMEGTQMFVATADTPKGGVREGHGIPLACLKDARGDSPNPTLLLSQYCEFYKPHPSPSSPLPQQHPLLPTVAQPASQLSTTSPHFTADVLENSPLGTLVATVTAFDLDDDWVTEELSYSICSDNPQSEAVLEIDSRTGVISTRGRRLSFSLCAYSTLTHPPTEQK